jgi:hypothetical protein
MRDENLILIKSKLKKYLIDDLINIVSDFIPIELWTLNMEYGSYSDYNCMFLGICSSFELAIFSMLEQIINCNSSIRNAREFMNNFNSGTYDKKNDIWNFKISEYIEEHINFFFIQNMYMNNIFNADFENTDRYNMALQVDLKNILYRLSDIYCKGIPLYISNIAKNYKPEVSK